MKNIKNKYLQIVKSSSKMVKAICCIIMITFATMTNLNAQIVDPNATDPDLGAPVLSITNTPTTYTGLPQAATVTSSSGGTVSNIKYGGSSTIPTNAGNYIITADVAANGSYTSATGLSAGIFIISPAPLTITSADGTKTYGQLKTSPVTGSTAFTASGLVNGETIGTITRTYSAGALAANATVGTTSTITPSSPTGGTFTASNYSISYVSGTLSITPATLNIWAVWKTKTYGATQVAAVSGITSASSLFTNDALQNGETIGSLTLSYGNGAIASTDPVGNTSTITPSNATGGTFTASNYNIIYNSGTLTVGVASLIITAKNSTKTYGSTQSSTSSSSSGFLTSGLKNGEAIGSVTLTYGSGALSATDNVGNTSTITPSAAIGGTFTASNYSISYVAGSLTVSAASLTITANVQSKTYGTASSTTGVLGNTFVVSGLQNSDAISTVSLSYTNSGNTETASVANSPYIISPSAPIFSIGLSSNYSISYLSNNLTVSAAVLSITADNTNKPFGTTLLSTVSGATTFSSIGLKNGETIGSVTLTYGVGALSASAVSGSTSTITPSLATGGTFNTNNYSINYNPGLLSVISTVPDIPVNVTADEGDASAVISFDAPTNNGGVSIIGYTVKAYTGATLVSTKSAVSSPYTFTGLINGVSYTFTVAAMNSVGTGASATTSPAIIPTLTTIWDGTSWSAGIPTASSLVVIDGNYNTNAAFICKNLQINTGKVFNSNNTITVTGSPIVINGSITGTGTLLLNSTSTQIISGNGIVSNATINTNAGVTISGGSNSLGITGVLTLQSGQLTTNGNLTFKSTSIANTGTLAPYGASGNTGTINGTVTVERYIPAGFRAYRDMASQLYGVGTIYNNWQEGGILTSGKGIFITGGSATDANVVNYGSQPTPNANGLDYSLNGNNSAFTYSYPTFTPIANTKITLDPFVGYRVLIRGDRSFNLATTPIDNYYNVGLRMVNPTVLRSIGGKLITGTVTYNTTSASGTTYDNVTISSTDAKLNGNVGAFSLVANPYVAPVQWGTGTVTNSVNTTVYGASNAATPNAINGSYWYLDPTFGDVGRYIAFNALTGAATVRTILNGDTAYNSTTSLGYIQPGQAVFVQTFAVNPQVVFKETAKSVTSTKSSIFGVNVPLSKIYISLLKKDSTAAYNRIDGAAIAFNEGFTNDAYGPQDALKFGNANDNLYISDKGKNLSIDGRLPATAADKLPIAINKVSGTNYQLVVDATNYTSNGFAPYLVDSYRGTVSTLTNGTNTITFTADANVVATYSNRFSIVFKPTTLAVGSVIASATLKNNIATISWNTVGEKGITRFEVEKSADAKSFTKIGQVSAKNTASASYYATDNDMGSTISYYRIKAISEVGTVSYSNLVQLTGNSNQFTVYPNPLVGKTLNVSFGNVAAGKYTVTINNVLGQKVQEVAISHASGNGSHAISVNSSMAAGTYNLTVRAANGQTVYQSNLSFRP